jgi:hypothetical protein
MEINKITPIDDATQFVSVTLTHGSDSYGFDANTPVLEGDELQAHCDANEFKWLNNILYQVYGRNIQFPTLEKWDEWIAAGCKLEEITETIVTPAQPVKDAVMGKRQVTAEREVEEEVSKTEVVLKDGKYVQQTTTETVTDTINERQFTEQQLYNEDGTPQTRLVTAAVEAAAATEYVEAVHAVEAAEAVYEDQVVVHAEAERTETHITQEAREEVKSERHAYSEVEVTETVVGEEIVLVDGKWTKQATSEEVTRIERTPLYTDCDLYNEDGSICTVCVTEAVEAVAAVIGEGGNELVPAIEAVAEVRENVVHKVALMEEYISQTAQEEVIETTVTPAVEEVTERICTHEAVEAVEGVAGVEEAEAVEAVAEVTEPVMHSVPTMEEYEVSPAVEAVEETSETVVVRAEAVVDKVAWKDTAE